MSEESLPGSYRPLSDRESEMCVIGAILVDGSSINSVAGFLYPEHFEGEDTRLVYAACVELFDAGTHIDQLTLRAQLDANGHLDDIGDSFLSFAAAEVPHALNIQAYAHRVHNMYILRRLALAGEHAVNVGSNPKSALDPDAAVREVEEVIHRIGENTSNPDFVAIKNAPAIEEFYGHSTDTDGDGPNNSPIPTGFNALDGILGGFHRSDLIVLAARPGVGKSALALNCALNAAKQGYKVAIFSLEMSLDQVVHRLAAAHSKLDISAIRQVDLTVREQARLGDAYQVFNGIEIHVDDSATQTVVAMRGKARRQMKLLGGLDFIIVDYMQLISGLSGREGNRVQEVSEISRNLKAIARDLNVPVLACSQLSRAIEHRRSQEPKLSDLRESGSIEQDADIVMFIHRVDKFMSEDEWNRRNPTQDYPKGLAEIHIAKHRHGPTGMAHMAVRDEWGLFSSIQQVTN